eukprot:TRINITY_DN11680_c1_g1_i1.p1 TRINITY_DN11680_c1_g1~~TRINITY_DN11680_c1_g1_i1.p1  ORF type:complete len:662 (+),score=270.71 TRINITY_DN11680_c1_g1_i1:93-2078(+)
MGKMGKKGSKALKAPSGKTVPPTKANRLLDPKKHAHLRSNRTTAVLNMRKSKVVRDKKTGEIIKGSVLDPSDKIQKGKMARIAPDKRWFGNSRVIGQNAMEEFKDEMAKKLADPYSVLIKPAKLPLSLLEEPKKEDGALEKKQLDFKNAFGKKSHRKRAQVGAADYDELKGKVETKAEGYRPEKDRQLLMNVERERDALTRTNELNRRALDRDLTVDRHPMEKGQSPRIWNQLWKVIDSSDVLLQVLDARDPLGTRSKYLEQYLQKEKKYKHLIFILNKVDLVPTWVTARWLQILSKERPTIAFHASLTNPFGKGNLINLLRQFSRLRGSGKKGGSTLSCGLFGYPNVGKSSVINTLRAKKVCTVAPIPGETRVWQYVNLSKKIFLIDCPGVVYDRDHNNSDVQAVLKGIVRVERLGIDKSDVVETVLDIVKKEDMSATYGIEHWRDTDHFLEQVARRRGKLLKGDVADVDCAARMVLHDWIEGRLPWFNAPPFDSNQQFRDAQDQKEGDLLRRIQHYSTFNIVNQELRNSAEEADGPLLASMSKGQKEGSAAAPAAAAAADEDGGEEEEDEEDEEDEEEEEEAAPAAKGRHAAPAPAAPPAKRPRTAPGSGAAPGAGPAAGAPAAAESWEALRAAARSARGLPAAAAAGAKPKVRLVRKR